MPPIEVASLKRLRSPSLLAATVMPEPVASGNSERRKPKFDSDSEMEKMENAIYVNSTVRFFTQTLPKPQLVFKTSYFLSLSRIPKARKGLDYLNQPSKTPKYRNSQT